MTVLDWINGKFYSSLIESVNSLSTNFRLRVSSEFSWYISNISNISFSNAHFLILASTGISPMCLISDSILLIEGKQSIKEFIYFL